MNPTQYKKVFDAVYRSGEPDPKRGFSGWQVLAQNIRKAVQEAERQYEADRNELYEIYSKQEAERRLTSKTEELNDIKRFAVKKLEDALEDVRAEKEKQFQDIALAPPSPGELRLIQTLALRDDLSDEEVSSVAATLGHSLQALKALGSIARRNGLDFPALITAEAFNESMNQAEEFCRNMLYSMNKSDSALGYDETCFWRYTSTGRPAAIFNPLDKPLFSAVQIKRNTDNDNQDQQNQANEKKPRPEKIKPRPVRHQTDGVDDLVFLSRKYGVKMKDIIRENPDAGLGDLESTTTSLPRGLVLNITPGEGYQDTN